ncbi:MAG: nucleotidyltransferase family protein [Clostridia bacterium]|nr:nucleotidyltransferase family protein [Clostridia bacterium]
MKTTAIICEFNPLHPGHEYAIHYAKRESDAVIAVMSSDIVQRAEPAIMPAVMRARLALAAGCDLVLELPAPCSFGSAEYFARAGVYIANATGVCDRLLFGSESGDINELESIAEHLASDEYKKKLLSLKDAERASGHMQARYNSAEMLYGKDFADKISTPNNILALEYIKAAGSLDAEMKLETVKREGSGYNDTVSDAGFVSASFLRTRIMNGKDISSYVSKACLPVYEEAKKTGMIGASIERLGPAILSYFRLAKPEELSEYAEMCDGLEYRLCNCAHNARDINEFFTLAATKKYTNARIRRAVLSCMLGLLEIDFKRPPLCVRALAANETGLLLLKRMKEVSKIPVITNVSGYDEAGLEYAKELALKTESLYTLALPKPLPSAELFKQGIFIDKK